MKLVLRIALEKMEKLGFKKVILQYYYRNFQDEIDERNRIISIMK